MPSRRRECSYELSLRSSPRSLARAKAPLVVIAEGGIFKTNYQYLMSYKGIAFFTKSSTALTLPAGAEVVTAGDISIPS